MTRFEIVVKGDHKTWGFSFEADSKYLPDWIKDGLNVAEIVETIPYEDRPIRTLNQLLDRTEPYLFHSSEMIDTAGMPISAGWWMSAEALSDYERFECNN
jgi:hypothetical protein